MFLQLNLVNAYLFDESIGQEFWEASGRAGTAFCNVPECTQKDTNTVILLQGNSL